MAAKFTTNVTSGLIPLTVEFTNTSDSPTTVAEPTWEWQFGDGKVSTEKDPVNVYTADPGPAGILVTLFATIDNEVYEYTSVIYPTSTRIGQHVKVQGNSIQYGSADKDVALRLDLNGELYVGRKSAGPALITSFADTDLDIMSAAGTLLSLNGVSWPDKPGALKPLTGQYVGLSAASTLSYLKFFPYETTSDTLTEALLNSSYPDVMPGQQVLAPNFIYVCVNSGKWRKVAAPAVS